MAMPDAKPESVGIDPVRLERAADLIERAVKEHALPGATLVVARRGSVVMDRAFGLARPAEMVAAAPDTVWLMASLSKPVTYMALLLLVERGELSLEQPVRELIPEFAGAGKEAVRVVHLMTHTSGLPDMVVDNEALRKRHASLADFISGACKADLHFPAGTKVSYQSMGTLLCAAIVERITKTRLRDFLQSEFFGPMGLRDTWYGIRRDIDLKHRRLAMVSLPAETERQDWNWNGAYWRELGAPWGALQSTAREFAAFLQLLLDGGTSNGKRILSPATVRAMISDQTARLPKLSAETKLIEPWGLGWALEHRSDNREFADLVAPGTFGHWGSTGNVCWADPTVGLVMVLLTNRPLSGDRSLHRRVGNAVAASAVG